MVGTAEFVAPEVVNYDDISINTGEVTSAHDDSQTHYLLRPMVPGSGGLHPPVRSFSIPVRR
jgi:hypothetical protein